jgi:hypothetical protein
LIFFFLHASKNLFSGLTGMLFAGFEGSVRIFDKAFAARCFKYLANDLSSIAFNSGASFDEDRSLPSLFSGPVNGFGLPD